MITAEVGEECFWKDEEVGEKCFWNKAMAAKYELALQY